MSVFSFTYVHKVVLTFVIFLKNMTESRKSAVITKSVLYEYDIEYVKHYNYYDSSECLEDIIMDTKYIENENREDCQESIVVELCDDFLKVDDQCTDEDDEVPELQKAANRSFSFIRVSTANWLSMYWSKYVCYGVDGLRNEFSFAERSFVF